MGGSSSSGRSGYRPGIAAALLWGVAGALIGDVLGKYLGPIPFGPVEGMFVALLLWLALNVRAELREKAAAREAHLESLRAQAEATRRALAAARTQTVDAYMHTLAGIAATCRRALSHLEQADSEAKAASHHRTEPAYTPFWEAVERSFAHLDSHRQDLHDLTTLTQSFNRAAENVANLPDPPRDLPPLPAELEQFDTSAAYAKIAANLEREVERAHRVYEFSSIYEQRRTTSAIVTGFGSLSKAVATVGAAVRDSHAALAGELRRSNETLSQMQAASPLDADSLWARPNTYGAQIVEINQALQRISRS